MAWTAQHVFAILVLLAIMGAAFAALAALDKAKNDFAREIERVRANPTAAVALPNPHIELARTASIAIAVGILLLLFVGIGVPWLWTKVNEAYFAKKTVLAKKHLKKYRARKEAAAEEEAELQSALGEIDDMIEGVRGYELGQWLPKPA